mmetsp:Transcript_80811/g.224881  ORF Transcript_80811/g.224881 Transcript_80811/m.224881 type:complete len:201 (+) Transcript_80811:1164-1766(+)
MFLFSEVAQRHNALVGAWSVGQYRLDDLRTVFVNLEAVQGPDAHRGSKVLDLSSQLQQDKLRTIGDVALVDRSIVAEFLASVQELHPMDGDARNVAYLLPELADLHASRNNQLSNTHPRQIHKHDTYFAKHPLRSSLHENLRRGRRIARDVAGRKHIVERFQKLSCGRDRACLCTGRVERLGHWSVSQRAKRKLNRTASP